MKKIFTAVVFLTLLFAVVSYAAGTWQFIKAFPDTVQFNSRNGRWYNSAIHGLAVSPDGNVWVQPYYSTDSILIANDILGRKKAIRCVYIYKPDGTPASFSPIKGLVTIGTLVDTLDGAGVGLRADHNGNILMCRSYRLYRLNYRTGAGMNKFVAKDSTTLAAPAVDAAGDIFVGKVSPGYPMNLIDANFTDLGNALDATLGFSRSHNVSADGNDLYYTAFGDKKTRVFHSDFGTLGPYVLKDSLFNGMAVESSCWNQKTKLLYLSSGGQTPSDPPYANVRWYGVNVATKTIVDTIVWNFDLSPSVGANDVRPRAIAFSVSGDTAYVAQFNGTGPQIQMFRRPTSDVRQDADVIPTGFTLSQNYPNPFNPTTEIKFAVVRGGLTTLVVYDMLGREVATLANEYMAPGAYTASFDASKLSSGTYLYRLTSGGMTLTKKMMVVK